MRAFFAQLPRFRCTSLGVLACASLLGLVVLPTPGAAQNWRWEPTISVSADYNDNIRLADVNEDRVAGGTVEAALVAISEGPRSLIRITPRVRASEYPDDPQEESTDGFLNAFFQRDFLKSQVAFEARYASEAVLSAEINDPDFDNPDIDTPINDDSGRVRVENTRDRLIVAPRAQYELNEKTLLGIELDYVDVSYDRDALSNLVDYDQASLGFTFARELDERNTFTATIFGTRYEADAINSSADSVGFTARYARQFSPRWSGYFDAGVEQVDSEADFLGRLTTSSDTAPLVGLGLTREFEVSRVVLDVARAIDPEGSGALTVRDQLRLRYEKRLTPLFTGGIGLRLLRTESVSDTNFVPQRDFGRIEVFARWRISRAWTIVGLYALSQQEFENEVSTATSNAVRLGISYSPRQRP